MKNRKSILIALPLVLAMLFVSLAPFAVVPAKADDDDLDLIYYFSDYYPTLDVATLNENFPDYGVVYHHQWVTEATLYDAVMQGFPSNANVHTVIIDIKSFKPSGAVLNSIFSVFALQGYKTVFVTPYDQAEFDTQSFWNLVDRYCHSNLSTLYGFIDWALEKMYTHNDGTLSDTTILIDGRLIDPLYSNDSDALADRFPFYKILSEELDYWYSTATNVHLVVHGGGNFFYDLSSNPIGNSYVASGIDDFTDANENLIWEHICAIGFTNLETDFHNFVRNCRGSFDEMPLYLLEAATPTYGEGGLEAMIFTTEDAMGMAGYGMFEELETEKLLAILASLLP